jgi:hypothetical protein
MCRTQANTFTELKTPSKWPGNGIYVAQTTGTSRCNTQLQFCVWPTYSIMHRWCHRLNRWGTRRLVVGPQTCGPLCTSLTDSVMASWLDRMILSNQSHLPSSQAHRLIRWGHYGHDRINRSSLKHSPSSQHHRLIRCSLCESASRPPCGFWWLNDNTIKELMSLMSFG